MKEEQELLSFGFKEWNKNPHDNFDRIWYYTHADRYGKKFQVAVRFWNFKQYGADHDGWDSEAYLEGTDGGNFRIIKEWDEQTIEELVNWFHNVFNKLNCKYYELND